VTLVRSGGGGRTHFQLPPPGGSSSASSVSLAFDSTSVVVGRCDGTAVVWWPRHSKTWVRWMN
jgi:hypothetical protein